MKRKWIEGSDVLQNLLRRNTNKTDPLMINENDYISIFNDFIENRSEEYYFKHANVIEFPHNTRTLFHCLKFNFGSNYDQQNDLFKLFIDSRKYPFTAESIVHIVNDLIFEVPFLDGNVGAITYQFPPGVLVTWDAEKSANYFENRVCVCYEGVGLANLSNDNFYNDHLKKTFVMTNFDYTYRSQRVISILRDFARLLGVSSSTSIYKFSVAYKFEQNGRIVISKCPFEYNSDAGVPLPKIIKDNMLGYLYLH